MYTAFFRLNQTPFSIAPDPRYLFMSERHREALAHLLYGVGSGGGFVLLTGEIGAGKTTICRCFLEQVPADCNVAYIFNPKLTVNELLQSVCHEFRIATGRDHAATARDYVDALNHYLLDAHAQGRNNVLIIDEAQNLSPDVLEQLRLLTNLETNERKLLQIILIGQPELRAMLSNPALEQLAQRVVARYHLDALSEDETARYIVHRLSVAGLTTAPPFRQPLLKATHRLTQGVPRRINLLCDRALLGAYAEGKPEVDRAILGKAAREVFGKDDVTISPGMPRWRHAALGAIAGGAIIGVAAWALLHGTADMVPLRADAVVPGIVEAKAVAASTASTAGASLPAASRIDASISSVPAVVPPAGDAMDTGGAPDAYRQIARLWGMPLADGALCELARSRNLECYRSNGGLAELRLIDRPAILTLHDDAGKIRHAALIGLTDATATLRMDGVTETVGLLELAHNFGGEFTTLWRTPPGYREKIEPGESGEEIDWLAAQLATLNGAGAGGANQPFGPALARQVREFQLAHGLRVDGIVGPQTLMQLNRVAGVDEPHLQYGIAAANPRSRK